MYVPLFLVFLWIVLWCQLNVESFAPLWTSEDKKDYTDHTMGSFTDLSLADCKKKCVKNTTCKGIVTDYAGDGKGTCWMKSDWGEVKEDGKRFTYKLTRT